MNKKPYAMPSAEMVLIGKEDIMSLSGSTRAATFTDGPSVGFENFN
ncbi:MAG: hypothetical protein IJW44_03090 [Clostridia bacterium]|nr:hypothetical protein [Clostridia bacterium]